MIAAALSRKAVAFFVTASLMMFLQRFGMSPEDLSSKYGLGFDEVSETVVEFLMTVGLPTFIGWLQPNEIGDSIFRYWRIGLTGIVAIVLLMIIFWWLA